jgi:aspartate carbamoyltransferase catalytic subunit
VSATFTLAWSDVHLLRIADLPSEHVRDLLDHAHGLRLRQQASQTQPFVAGLAFFSSSLRTRIGFAVAAGRLGGSSVDVNQLRWGAGMSAAESVEDSLRAVSGMCDVLVVRLDQDLVPFGEQLHCPTVNGGDSVEHPTQALIDLFAVEVHSGPWTERHLTLCGDLTMRSVRSLVSLLGRFPPSGLALVAPPGREFPFPVPAALAGMVTMSSELDPVETDVLYLSGLPASRGEQHISADVRGRYSLSQQVLVRLPSTAVVLCPLPVVDEVPAVARSDERLKMFHQSDDGVFVRQAVLAHLLATGRGR